jgi:glycosidase
VSGDGVSVEEQAGDSASLLSHYKALIRLRAAHPALACGSTRVLSSGSGAIALKRTFQGQQAAVIFNFSDTPADVNVVVAKAADAPLKHIFGATGLRAENGTLQGRIGPYESSVWIIP